MAVSLQKDKIKATVKGDKIIIEINGNKNTFYYPNAEKLTNLDDIINALYETFKADLNES